MYKTLQMIQAEQKSWASYNFPKNIGREMLHIPVMGVAEESGELCHHALKMIQGIRGTDAEHEANIKDAIGDISIYMMDICNKMGWDFEAVINEVWATVIQRDWQKNKENGVTA